MCSTAPGTVIASGSSAITSTMERPGTGTIAPRKTMWSTGRRSATTGTANPPSEWPTTTTCSASSGIVAITVSAHSPAPAGSS